ncbi:MAG: hypothetical protein EXR28_13630 [Betaproteobacteria bacterium]|nr:hypothetical protein [Betaproteobacteria bacterium]
MGEQYKRELLIHVGPKNLLWASDCPFAGFEGKVTYRETIDAVMAWMSDEATRHKVFCENAMKLYFS